MQVLGASRSVVSLRLLVRETHQPIDFIDITEDVEELVRETGLREGIVTVFSRHTTASVRVQEDEPLLLEDLRAFLERCAPQGAHYRHNDFRIRTVHMHEDESPNGHSHCQQILLGTSETIPVTGGRLMLGRWQRVFLVELDGPRDEREIAVQILGTTD